MTRSAHGEIVSKMKSIGLRNLPQCPFVYARFGVFGAIVPLFAVQYFLSEKLLVGPEISVTWNCVYYEVKMLLVQEIESHPRP